jgi:hypothetical protein
MELLELLEYGKDMDQDAKHEVKATAVEWSTFVSVHAKICESIEARVATESGPLGEIGALATIAGYKTLHEISTSLLTSSTPLVTEISEDDLPTTLISISISDGSFYRACTSILTLLNIAAAQKMADDPENDLALLEITSTADTFTGQFKAIAEGTN